MIEMNTLTKRRRLRGLVLHHRRHPSRHHRRLVLRTARWAEKPVAGICRWCGGPAARIDLTWHPYCLDSYRVASGQKPEELQVTMCEICAGPSAEIDHRLAINVARALGPAALRRAFTVNNLRFLCRECHRRKTRLDRCLAAFARDCSMDWRTALRAWVANREWATMFLGPFGLELGNKGVVASGAKQTVDVAVLYESTSQARSVLEILNSGPEHRLFQTAAEVDVYLSEERASWER